MTMSSETRRAMLWAAIRPIVARASSMFPLLRRCQAVLHLGPQPAHVGHDPRGAGDGGGEVEIANSLREGVPSPLSAGGSQFPKARGIARRDLADAPEVRCRIVKLPVKLVQAVERQGCAQNFRQGAQDRPILARIAWRIERTAG